MLLSLPRELRDIIYTSILTSPYLSPSPHDASQWYRPQPVTDNLPGSVAMFTNIAYARHVPPTCGALLVTCRQVHAEMLEAISMLRARGKLEARAECAYTKQRGWRVRWVNIPIITTTLLPKPITSTLGGKCIDALTQLPSLPPCRWLWKSTRGSSSLIKTSKQHYTTRIARLHIALPSPTNYLSTPTILLTALAHLLRPHPLNALHSPNNKIYIDEVIFDIEPPFPSQPPHNKQDKELSRSLLAACADLWTDLPALGHPLSQNDLLEKVGRVHVCIAGERVGTRIWAEELARGRQVVGRG